MAQPISSLAKWVRTDHWPQVDCPVCQRGVLAVDSLAHVATVASIAEYDRRPHDATLIHGQFHGLLKCTSPTCGEPVTVAGRYSVDYDATDDGRYTKEFDYYLLQYANPALLLVKTPPETPTAVVKALQAASAVLWIDPSAAANRLRVAVDKLLTAQKIRATTINKYGKREPIKTHNRVLALKSRPSKTTVEKAVTERAANALLAVKVIGNTGSHESRLTVMQVLKSVGHFGYALRLLYDRSDKDIEREVAAVIRRKGPV